jgi:hypothetical protein
VQLYRQNKDDPKLLSPIAPPALCPENISVTT